MKLSVLVDVDDHIRWPMVDLPWQADGAGVQAHDAALGFKAWAVRMTEHRDVTASRFRFIDDALEVNAYTKQMSVGKQAPVLSELHFDVLRKAAKVIIVTLDEVALNTIAGVLRYHSFIALGVT